MAVETTTTGCIFINAVPIQLAEIDSNSANPEGVELVDSIKMISEDYTKMYCTNTYFLSITNFAETGKLET